MRAVLFLSKEGVMGLYRLEEKMRREVKIWKAQRAAEAALRIRKEKDELERVRQSLERIPVVAINCKKGGGYVRG